MPATADKTAITVFFELTAQRLGIDPQRLAALVNDFETMPLRYWDELLEVDNIEMADIENLRARLLKMLANAKNH